MNEECNGKTKSSSIHMHILMDGYVGKAYKAIRY